MWSAFAAGTSVPTPRSSNQDEEEPEVPALEDAELEAAFSDELDEEGLESEADELDADESEPFEPEVFESERESLR